MDSYSDTVCRGKTEKLSDPMEYLLTPYRHMKQEPVSTIQVSSGRLESTRALKDMKRSGWP